MVYIYLVSGFEIFIIQIGCDVTELLAGAWIYFGSTGILRNSRCDSSNIIRLAILAFINSESAPGSSLMVMATVESINPFSWALWM